MNNFDDFVPKKIDFEVKTIKKYRKSEMKTVGAPIHMV